MDTVSETRIGEVYPGLAEKIRQMAQMLETEGIDIRVSQSYRSWQEQDSLYSRGRTAPGTIVTDARGGYSWHNFGLAVDVVPLTAQGVDWNTEHPVWKRIVAVGESLGLVAGAEWRTFPDWPHFQLTGRFPVTPNDEVRLIYQGSGLQGVWHEAFVSEGA